MMGGDTTAARSRVQTERFQFGPWFLVSIKSHILKSEGTERERFEGALELPQVPEMIFADNVLRITHADGFGIEFNALDALKRVDAHHDPLKVAVSQAWREARSECEHINDVIKPFDWTYTTDYKGTVIGQNGKEFKISPTEERIDIEKLKKKEKIIFYEDMLLFEDELADNGASILNVKMRVMPTSFFILMRLFMRVDNVIVRVNDTRIYHEAGQNFILREYTSKDDYVKDLKVPLHVLQDPNEVVKHLSTKAELFEKLEFPDNDPTDTKQKSTDSENSTAS